MGEKDASSDIGEEIGDFLTRADDIYFSEAGRAPTNDPKKQRTARGIYLAAAEKAETAASRSHGENSNLFREKAAHTYKLAGDIAQGLKDYEGAAHDYGNSMENFDKTELDMVIPPAYQRNQEQLEQEARDGLKKMTRKIKRSALIKRILPKFSILMIIVGTSFLSLNLTGNVIGSLATKTSSIIGAGLFVLGIVGSYSYFRKK